MTFRHLAEFVPPGLRTGTAFPLGAQWFAALLLRVPGLEIEETWRPSSRSMHVWDGKAFWLPPRFICVVAAVKFIRQERVQAFAGGCSRGAGKRASNLRHRLVVENAGEARAPHLGQQLNREAVQLSTSATSLEGEVLTTSEASQRDLRLPSSSG